MNKRLGTADIDFVYLTSQAKCCPFKDKIRYSAKELFTPQRTLGNYTYNNDANVSPNHINIFLNNIYLTKTRHRACNQIPIERMIYSIIEHESIHSAFQQTMPKLNEDEHNVQWIQFKFGHLVLEASRLFL